jgi:phage tail-like protein
MSSRSGVAFSKRGVHMRSSSSLTRRLVVLTVAAVAVGAVVMAPAGQGQGKNGSEDFVASRYVLSQNGTVLATFDDLLGMTSEVEAVEYKTGGEKGPAFGKLAGRAKPPTVTLRRVMTYGLGLFQWHQEARAGKPSAFRTVDLVMYNAAGKAVARWSLVNAWPSKVEVSALKAGANSIPTESVTLTADEIVRMTPTR